MPLHRPPLASLALLSSLSLTACVQPVATTARPAPLPLEVWQCQDQPTLPLLTDDAGFADWVASGLAAGQDCRDKLATAHTIVEGN